MRNKRIDVLRFVAVLVVVLHHWSIWRLFRVWGWVGVDLFFVLSGFLISGLLFAEYQKRETIRFRRFFLRRGLKIYPAFFVFLLVTGLAQYFVLHQVAPAVLYFNEGFFVMNYLGGIFPHTWSLGVEEHFYLALPLALSVLMRRSIARDDPFRLLPYGCLVVAVLCILTRAFSALVGQPNYDMVYMATHNRMDALSCGVLLGYLHHFRPHIPTRLLLPAVNRIAIFVLSAVLLSAAYFIPRESRFFAVFGFTFIYLGWAGVLLLCLHVRGVLPGAIAGFAGRLGSFCAYFGMFSYSIYLWQGETETWFPGLLRLVNHIPYGPFAVSVIGTFALGVGMSKLVEYPVLRLRDRFFPAMQAVPDGARADVSSLSALERPATV